jgi:SAM-dependent methyltransferase
MKNVYPSDYHSSEKPNAVVKAAEKRRNSYILFKKSILGRIIYRRHPEALFELLGKASVSRDSRVLDVGCGAGLLLDRLRDVGFTNLLGIDPYVKVFADRGIRIEKKTIEDLTDDDKFNVIIFNHSFEHVSDPLRTLQKVSKLLAQDGVCVIRMPLKTDLFWNRYGNSWYGIQAPQHFTIHTIKSFELLAEKTELIVEDTILYTEWDMIARSEKYARDIPSRLPDSHKLTRTVFSARQIREFKKLAKELSSAGRGDIAVFCLRKRNSPVRESTISG